MRRALDSASRKEYGIFDNHYLRIGVMLQEQDYEASRQELRKLILIDTPNKDEVMRHRHMAVLLESLISRHQGIISDSEVLECFRFNPDSNYKLLSSLVSGGYLGIDFIFPLLSKVLANFGTSFCESLSPGYTLLRNRITDAVTNKLPFSFVRLNDGEGCLLYAMDKCGESLNFESHIAIQMLWKAWFGVDFTEDYLPTLANMRPYFADLIKNSSMIGIDYEMINNWHLRSGMESKLGSYYAGFKVVRARPHDAIINSDALYSLEEEDNFLSTLLHSLVNVSCISCHPNLQKLLTAKGLRVRQNIVVPAEQRFNSIFGTQSQPGSHLDSFFSKTLQLIRGIDPQKSHFWIVAAGPLGKIYTNELFKIGCCVLDIGAVMDGLLGFARRPRLKQFAI